MYAYLVCPWRLFGCAGTGAALADIAARAVRPCASLGIFLRARRAREPVGAVRASVIRVSLGVVDAVSRLRGLKGA